MQPVVNSFRWIAVLGLMAAALPSCKTKMDVQREQEMERLKQEVRSAKGTKADLDVVSEQVRTELTRMTNYVEEQTIYQRRQSEEMRQEIQALATKLESVESKLASIEEASRAEREAEKAPPSSIEAGQKLIDTERFDEASEVFRDIVRKSQNSVDVRRARYLLGESLFLGRNYASAALEYSEYKRSYPKDPRVAEATFRQAQCFKSLNKRKEARLFFQELLDKYPKSTLVPRARDELKKLK
jgi:TolA-binding protein